jgi:hypothetical protein
MRTKSKKGYKAIDISGKDERLYSPTCRPMLAPSIMSIPKYTKGELPLVLKTRTTDAPWNRERRWPRHQVVGRNVTQSHRRQHNEEGRSKCR